MTGAHDNSCCCNHPKAPTDREASGQTQQSQTRSSNMSNGCCGAATPSTEVPPTNKSGVDQPVCAAVAP